MMEKTYDSEDSCKSETAQEKVDQIKISIKNTETTCAICLKNTGEKEIRLSCGHAFCLTCFEENLHQKVRRFAYFKQIGCPLSEKCGTILGEAQFKGIVSEELLKKYRFVVGLRQRDNTQVLCPYIGCLGSLDSVKSSWMKVCSCKPENSMCYYCDSIVHYGNSCFESMSEFPGRLLCDRAFFEKQCPYCSSTQRKMFLRNVHECTACKRPFCFLCLKRASKFHFREWNFLGCPHQEVALYADSGMRTKAFKVFMVKTAKWIGLAILIIIADLIIPPFTALWVGGVGMKNWLEENSGRRIDRWYKKLCWLTASVLLLPIIFIVGYVHMFLFIPDYICNYEVYSRD